MDVSGQPHAPTALFPRKGPIVHTGGRLGSQPVWIWVSLLAFEPRLILSVAKSLCRLQRVTYWSPTSPCVDSRSEWRPSSRASQPPLPLQAQVTFIIVL